VVFLPAIGGGSQSNSNANHDYFVDADAFFMKAANPLWVYKGCLGVA
jgi:hypothetical protein